MNAQQGDNKIQILHLSKFKSDSRSFSNLAFKDKFKCMQSSCSSNIIIGGMLASLGGTQAGDAG